MNIKDLNIRVGVLSTIVIGAIMIISFHSVAIASPDGHCDHMQMNREKMQQLIKNRLDRLEGRLEIKSSQVTLWEDFAKSVEMLSEQHVKEPGDDADAATISRYRADRAAEFAKKLAIVADATAKLQAGLTADQKKILNKESLRFFHRHRPHAYRGWSDQGHHDKWGKSGKFDEEMRQTDSQ